MILSLSKDVKPLKLMLDSDITIPLFFEDSKVTFPLLDALMPAYFLDFLVCLKIIELSEWVE